MATTKEQYNIVYMGYDYDSGGNIDRLECGSDKEVVDIYSHILIIKLPIKKVNPVYKEVIVK